MLENKRSKKGVVLYDSLKVAGGAESVTLMIAKTLPNVDLCLHFATPSFSEILSELESDVFLLGPETSFTGWEILKGIFKFKTKTNFLSEYDWALFSGTYAPVGVYNRRNRQNYVYCHTIPRFAYDLREFWLSRAAWWQYPLLLILTRLVRWQYESAMAKMDVVIANSQNVRKRLLACLGIESIVIHPPCNTDAFCWRSEGDYYLSTARLEPYKRVRNIVLAFIDMPDKKLVVASGGSELHDLQMLASNSQNISFTGWVDSEQMVALVGNSIASIYVPIDEDFGISPVESMAAGKPVIGVADGGLLETVLDNVTGRLIDKDANVEDIKKAVGQMDSKVCLTMREDCETRAKLFSNRVFTEKLKHAIGASQ